MKPGGGVYPLTERVPFDDVDVSTDSWLFVRRDGVVPSYSFGYRESSRVVHVVLKVLILVS
jgi:hypothetical protein